MNPEVLLTDEQLATIHLNVYRRYGYPTIEDGLRALKRVRKYAKKGNLTKIPPRHLQEKYGIWASINKDIRIMIQQIQEQKKKEAFEHAQPKQETPNQAET